MNYKLIMLPNPILVSDEEITKLDRFVYDSDLKKVVENTDLKTLTSFKSKCDYYHKIIGNIEELPKLDLSAIEEEIGWVDVESLALVNYPITPLHDDDRLKRYDMFADEREAFIAGFKAAQSLNEKKFSEEDMIEFAKHHEEYCRMISKQKWEGGKASFKQFLQMWLLKRKPKEYSVEVEMERTRYPKGDDGWEDIHVPKITNNTIKIIKLCKDN